MNELSRSKTWLIFTTLLIVLVGCAGTASQESTGEYLDDSVITTKVKSAVIADRQVSALDIKVETVKGVVQLNGLADNQQEIDRTTELALQVKNVKSVMNNIQLRQSSQNGL